MQAPLQRQPWRTPDYGPWPVASEVLACLQQVGQQAVFVGGAVRDELFAQACHDVDIATSASVAEIEALFPKTVAVGRSFGVMVVIHKGQTIEVATFRSDGSYGDGRHPQSVSAADEATDVARRDFTINALIADPKAGEVRDYVGGLADLAAGCLRVVGDAHERLQEDRLRVLRGLRFAAGFGLAIDPSTAQALRETSCSGLSRERIIDEWDKALALTQRAAWWDLVGSFGHAQVFLPELCPSEGVAVPGLDQATDGAVAELLIFQALVLNPASLRDWLSQQPMSKQRRVRVVTALQLLQRWLPGVPATPQRQRDARAAEAPLVVAALQALQQSAAAAKLEDEYRIQQQRGPIPRLLDGADLRALGLPPGPQYKQLLQEVEDAWLAQTLNTRQQAWDLVQQKALDKWPEGPA